MGTNGPSFAYLHTGKVNTRECVTAFSRAFARLAWASSAQRGADNRGCFLGASREPGAGDGLNSVLTPPAGLVLLESALCAAVGRIRMDGRMDGCHAEKK